MKTPPITETVTDEFMDNVGAVVLGGGQGSRLYPLTRVRAKPAVPLIGRYRLVDIPLSNCIHSGIKRMVVLTQFNSHSLNRHINNTYRFDNFTNGYVEVLPAELTADFEESWFQGTADAVRKQLIHIQDIGARYYVILSGDQLYRMDYRALMRTLVEKEADIVVAGLPVSRRDATGFGVMQVQGNGKIREFVEKPKEAATLDKLITPDKLFNEFGVKARGKPYLASMGVYAFKAEVLEKLIRQEEDWVDFGKHVLPGALKRNRVYVHMFDGFWEDIGTVRSYFEVSMALTSSRPPFKFYDPHHQIFTHQRALPGVKVQDAKVKNSILCEGSRITKATVENAIVGVRSIIHPGADISDTIMLGADYFEDQARKRKKIPMGIGAGAKISRAIIDHNARIGKNVVIRGGKKLPDQDGENYCIRDGIVIVLKNAVIPDGTVIG